MHYPWQRRLNCVSYSGFGANRRLHSSIRGIEPLDIYILRLTKRLCGIGELFSRLRWCQNEVGFDKQILSIYFRKQDDSSLGSGFVS